MGNFGLIVAINYSKLWIFLKLCNMIGHSKLIKNDLSEFFLKIIFLGQLGNSVPIVALNYGTLHLRIYFKDYFQTLQHGRT